jgi:hypothetical protein
MVGRGIQLFLSYYSKLARPTSTRKIGLVRHRHGGLLRMDIQLLSSYCVSMGVRHNDIFKLLRDDRN